MSFFLSLQANGIPFDVISYIWKLKLKHDEEEKEKQCPSAPKKGISERTKAMMKRWEENGRWIRHVRNIQFE